MFVTPQTREPMASGGLVFELIVWVGGSLVWRRLWVLSNSSKLSLTKLGQPMVQGAEIEA